VNDKPRPLDGLALLDQLRPPPRYRTTWAIGTTYSLDLVACVAAIVALDGRVRDTTGFTVPSALRALGNLHDRVRIFAQQGCIHHSPKSNPRILALFDSIVRPVPFDLARRTFHPKVWVVRQDPARDEDGAQPRFLLLVGSRNLTRDTSWDLGIALEGAPGKSTNIDGVRAFVERVCELGGEAGFGAEDARALDSVEWGDLPRGIKAVSFAWHGGDGKFRSTEEGHPLSLPVGQRLLVLTPFLDAQPVRQLAARWQHVSAENKLLLSGLDRLRGVAQKAPAQLASLHPCSIGVARDEPADTSQEEPSQALSREDEAELLEPDRGLHAKVIAVWTGKRAATVLLGSANLTDRAWNAANCEAWVIAEGSAELADALWVWASARATPFDAQAEVVLPPDDEEAKALEKVHHVVAARRFRLEEPGGAAPLLWVEPVLPKDALAGLSLRFARLSTPAAEMDWVGPSATEAPACSPDERTQFLLLVLRGETRVKAWIQAVEVAPPILSDRNAKALQRLLGPEQFLHYLMACLDERGGDGEGGDGGEEGDDGSGAAPGGRAAERPLRLEALLHAIARARKAGQEQILRHLDRAVHDYRSGQTSAKAHRLTELFDAWDAIREAMLP
jgi:hypothetical protein